MLDFPLPFGPMKTVRGTASRLVSACTLKFFSPIRVSMAGLYKRSVVGAYHQVSAKHFDAYLDEFEWRFNNRKNPFLFRDTILKLIASPNLECKNLTAKEKHQAA